MFQVPLLIALAVAPAVRDDVLADANALLDQGRAAEAVTMLTSALSAGGADERALRLLLAEAQVTDGVPREAVGTLDALDPSSDWEAALATGRAYLAWADQMRRDGAREDDARVVEMDGVSRLAQAAANAPPEAWEPAVEYGNAVLYRAGDPARAIAAVDKALETNPGNGELRLVRGCAGVQDYWTAKTAGDQDALRAAFASTEADLLAADEGLPHERFEPWSQLAWLYETHGRFDDAVRAAGEVYDRLSSQSPASLDELWRLAVRFSELRQWEAAGLAMEKIVSNNAAEVRRRIERSDDPTALATQLSWSVGPFMNRGDQVTALNVLKAIVASDPQSAVVWNNYAVMCENTSRFEDAAGAYEKVIAITPRDPRPYNDLGKVLQFDLKRDVERAKTLYEQCVAIADEELARDDLTAAERGHLQEARNYARQNMTGTQAQPAPGGGLLDRLRSGLRGLNVPTPEGEGADGSGDDAEGGDGSTGDGGGSDDSNRE